MAYDQQTWALGLAGGTALNDVHLNHMEQGIADAHSLVADLATDDHAHVLADITDVTATGAALASAATAAAARTVISAAATVHDHDDLYYTEAEVDTAFGDVDVALAGKAATAHTHIIANVTGLQTALDGKAASSHTHTAANITDFATAMAGLLVEGTNINLSVDGVTGAVTIDSTGGGGGTLATAPASTLVFSDQNSDGTWDDRPTSRTELKCLWTRIVAGSADPAAATTPGTTVDGAYPNDIVVGA